LYENSVSKTERAPGGIRRFIGNRISLHNSETIFDAILILNWSAFFFCGIFERCHKMEADGESKSQTSPNSRSLLADVERESRLASSDSPPAEDVEETKDIAVETSSDKKDTHCHDLSYSDCGAPPRTDCAFSYRHGCVEKRHYDKLGWVWDDPNDIQLQVYLTALGGRARVVSKIVSTTREIISKVAKANQIYFYGGMLMSLALGSWRTIRSFYTTVNTAKRWLLWLPTRRPTTVVPRTVPSIFRRALGSVGATLFYGFTTIISQFSSTMSFVNLVAWMLEFLHVTLQTKYDFAKADTARIIMTRILPLAAYAAILALFYGGLGTPLQAASVVLAIFAYIGSNFADFSNLGSVFLKYMGILTESVSDPAALKTAVEEERKRLGTKSSAESEDDDGWIVKDPDVLSLATVCLQKGLGIECLSQSDNGK